MIYLDYQATTPLAPDVLAVMMRWLNGDGFANPHSPHREGRRARAAVEVAREQLAALFPSGGQVSFTSGATEALNWALKDVGSGRIVTQATEHAAVLDTVEALRSKGREVIVLPVDSQGLIDLEAAREAIIPGTAMVAAMLVNNEIGVIQPIDELARMAHDAGAVMLCDAVQGYGRVPIPDSCDLIAVSAHKIYGPKGIGALWVRDGVTLEPLLHGGGQEAGGRSGTLSPALCAGFGEAARLMAVHADQDAAHIEKLFALALDKLAPGWTLNGAKSPRYRGNLNLRREGLDVARLMSELRDIAFSAGSACASGSGRASHVLRAIGLTEAQARASIRIGFGRFTDPQSFESAIERINSAALAQQDVA